MDNPAPATTPTLLQLWPAFILWLPMGLVFYSSSDHFGPGFLPTLVWFWLLPFLAALSAIASLVELVRLRKRLAKEWWRPLVWAVIGVLYWLTFGGWIPVGPMAAY